MFILNKISRPPKMARLERIKQMNKEPKTWREWVISTKPEWFCKELFAEKIKNLSEKQKDKQNERKEAKYKEVKSGNPKDWHCEKSLVYIYDIYQNSFWYGEDFFESYFKTFLTEKLEKIDSIDDFTFLTDSVENKELVEFLQENEINIKDTEKVKETLKHIIFFIATEGYEDGVNRAYLDVEKGYRGWDLCC